MSSSTPLKPLDYLVKLAPDFFSTRLAPADPKDLERLHAAAMRPIPQYHQEFLLAAGATPTDALNPFLNGLGFNTDALISGYHALAEQAMDLPRALSIFSASEDIDQYQFLRQDPGAETSPLLVTLSLDTGEFIPDELGTLENYLLDFAFAFRVAQLDHVRSFAPREDKRSEPGLAVLRRMGLLPVFRLPPEQICLEGGPWAAVIFGDGSGHIASDDLRALLEICELLDEHAGMEIKPRPDRLVAPKR